MLFGKEPEKKEAGRWSTPAQIQALSEKLQDKFARTSFGSGNSGSLNEYKEAARQKAEALANVTYQKASNAKHAALDWLSSYTTNK